MKVQSPIRYVLKEATDPVHQRLHRHDGFSAVACGTVSRDDYITLLKRLYGFHFIFDQRIAQAAQTFGSTLEVGKRQRASHVVQDLLTLGVDEHAIADIALCEAMHEFVTSGDVLGALYVVEGSTLGGLVLARALSPLLGPGVEGRRFFLGYGDRHGAMWQSFLDELDANAGPGRQEQIVNGALRTFHEFEAWMKDWRADTFATGLSRRSRPEAHAAS